MTRKDRQLLFSLAGLTLALAALTLVGLHGDILLAAPVLVLALPLLAGRYVGEQRLARLVAVFHAAPRRAAPALAPNVRRASHSLPRGGRLLACSLAVRPPPGCAPQTA